MNWIIDKEIGIEAITRLPNHDLREKILNIRITIL